MTKRQPEIDLIIKHATRFVTQKLDEIANITLDFLDDTPKPKTTDETASAGTPAAVTAKITRALTTHQLRAKNGTIINCTCGRSFNELAFITHQCDAVTTALTTPDPTADWWARVTDQV